MRSYLKAIARETWQLANWVTHSTSACEEHATFAYRATANVVMAFSAASRQREDVDTKRCPVSDAIRIRRGHERGCSLFFFLAFAWHRLLCFASFVTYCYRLLTPFEEVPGIKSPGASLFRRFACYLV